MVNTLYLPELREMLAEQNTRELREFCTTLHPARTVEFMEGLSPEETWQVLSYAEPSTRAELFGFFDHDQQVSMIESQERAPVAALIAELPPDDRVDILAGVNDSIVQEILQLLPADDRRDILRLSAYPDDSAGAMMTTDFARVRENFTVQEAIDEIRRQAEELETIYYVYVVDDAGHLRGLVSFRQLVAARPQRKLSDLMETELVTAHVLDDQEEVADQVAKFDLLAIPVVDDERRMMGIITHDDIIDVVREEATEDAHRSAAVEPLEESYLKTHLLTLSWKRGIWLTILFFCALLTAFALQFYENSLARWVWLVPFIPLVISSGGNTGSQSATLIVTALSRGHVSLKDWLRVVLRELAMGLILGGFLGICGYLVAMLMLQADPAAKDAAVWVDALVIPLTLLSVVVAGALTGSVLPLIFQRLGLDPALMSNPFVAGIIDILGIVIYMNVAWMILT